jgi:hypothetical protein
MNVWILVEKFEPVVEMELPDLAERWDEGIAYVPSKQDWRLKIQVRQHESFSHTNRRTYDAGNEVI